MHRPHQANVCTEGTCQNIKVGNPITFWTTSQLETSNKQRPGVVTRNNTGKMKGGSRACKIDSKRTKNKA